jgi:hypothetical protein
MQAVDDPSRDEDYFTHTHTALGVVAVVYRLLRWSRRHTMQLISCDVWLEKSTEAEIESRNSAEWPLSEIVFRSARESEMRTKAALGVVTARAVGRLYTFVF